VLVKAVVKKALRISAFPALLVANSPLLFNRRRITFVEVLCISYACEDVSKQRKKPDPFNVPVLFNLETLPFS